MESADTPPSSAAGAAAVAGAAGFDDQLAELLSLGFDAAAARVPALQSRATRFTAARAGGDFADAVDELVDWRR